MFRFGESQYLANYVSLFPGRSLHVGWPVSEKVSALARVRWSGWVAGAEQVGGQ